MSVHTLAGYPSPRFLPRSLVPGPFCGIPPPRPGQYGVSPSQVRMECLLTWLGGGYPHDRAAERALDTQRAVCLLRSRRRTFLFIYLTLLTPLHCNLSPEQISWLCPWSVAHPVSLPLLDESKSACPTNSLQYSDDHYNSTIIDLHTVMCHQETTTNNVLKFSVSFIHTNS